MPGSKPLNSATGDSNQQVTVTTDRKPTRLETLVSWTVLVTCGFLIAGSVTPIFDKELTLDAAKKYTDQQILNFKNGHLVGLQAEVNAKVNAQKVFVVQVLDDAKSEFRLYKNKVNNLRREVKECRK